MSLAGKVAYFTKKDPSLKIENALDDVTISEYSVTSHFLVGLSRSFQPAPSRSPFVPQTIQPPQIRGECLTPAYLLTISFLLQHTYLSVTSSPHFSLPPILSSFTSNTHQPPNVHPTTQTPSHPLETPHRPPHPPLLIRHPHLAFPLRSHLQFLASGMRSWYAVELSRVCWYGVDGKGKGRGGSL